jgi:hypothetical protein
VWQHVHQSADIHGYRAEYATAIYKAHARAIQDIPYDRINRGTGRRYQSQVYTCRKDEAGRKLDKAAMLVCSKALGHNRISVVADNYTLNEVLAPNQVNFLTWGNVTFPSPGKVRIEVRGQKVELDYPAQFKAELETVKLDDPRLSNVWGKEIYRITLKAEEKKMTGNYKFVIQQVK